VKFETEPMEPMETTGGEAGLSRGDLAELRERLLAERDAIGQRLASRRRTLVNATHPAADDADLASDNADQGLIARLVDRDAKLLREVESALHRMAIGTYGVCTLSGEPIGLDRLRSRPWTRHALEVKESVERQRADAAATSPASLLTGDDEAA
jgi:DnaK suppressor protein